MSSTPTQAEPQAVCETTAVASPSEGVDVALHRRPRIRSMDDLGMATAEYAVATLAACGFAGLLVALLSSGEVRGMLLAIVKKALTLG
ncbi:MAG TPA: DUF4244 domain-containing protein [Actinomycetales bacterium]|nr:DUF4244 domain-containing protein [Actinomycetales bacterium]